MQILTWQMQPYRSKTIRLPLICHHFLAKSIFIHILRSKLNLILALGVAESFQQHFKSLTMLLQITSS